MGKKKEIKELIKELQKEGKVVVHGVPFLMSKKIKIPSLEDDKIVSKDNELKK